MSESASLSLRERKSLATSSSLTAVSRRLTTARGLSGFTIDEVCSEVGISRRTFFNYFPSKEDAVIGGDSEEDYGRVAEAFLARGRSGWPAVIDDLVSLIIEHFDAAGVDANGHAEFVAALEAEPKLLVRFIGVSRERERALAELIASREGVAVDDGRALAVVNVLSTLIRVSADQLIAPDNDRDFSTILLASLAAFRAVLSNPTPGKARS